MADRPQPPSFPSDEGKNPQPDSSYPGGSYPPGGYPPPGYSQQPPPKKRRIWPWILIGLIVLAFAGCIAALTDGGDEATVIPGSDSAAPQASGLTFPGMQPGDTAANAGDTVTKDNIVTTTTALFDTSDNISANRTYLCTNVTIKNDSDQGASFNQFDWKLQDPTGTIRNTTFTGRPNQLHSGDTAPGGATTGELCFDAPAGAPPGQYIVLYDPSFDFSSDRIGWINIR